MRLCVCLNCGNGASVFWSRIDDLFTIALSEQHDFLVVLEELVQVIGRHLDAMYIRSVKITIAFDVY